MENLNIEHWDLRGWMGNVEPTPDAQREWNKTLIHKINLVSSKIAASSFRGNADTIVINPDIEIILHPDLYDDHKKTLANGIYVVLDPSVDKDRIEVKNLSALEDLRVIPVVNEPGSVTLLPLDDCSEDQIVSHINSLIGFVVIENI